jgi:hypothetical protein
MSVGNERNIFEKDSAIVIHNGLTFKAQRNKNFIEFLRLTHPLFRRHALFFIFYSILNLSIGLALVRD